MIPTPKPSSKSLPCKGKKYPTKPVWCKANLTFSEWSQIKILENNRHSLLQMICKANQQSSETVQENTQLKG